MVDVFYILVQLAFVSLVYYAAYRCGYKAAQVKAADILRNCRTPINTMLDQLDRAVDEAVEAKAKSER